MFPSIFKTAFATICIICDVYVILILFALRLLLSIPYPTKYYHLLHTFRLLHDISLQKISACNLYPSHAKIYLLFKLIFQYISSNITTVHTSAGCHIFTYITAFYVSSCCDIFTNVSTIYVSPCRDAFIHITTFYIRSC